MRKRLIVPVLAVVCLRAQAPTAPVISPRGVTNFFTQQPAPATVGLGGLIQINGLNLGPADGLTAAGTPWPNRLGDVQVTINGRPAPLYSVSAGAIIAQVPLTEPQGLADIVVRRQGGVSNPARIQLLPLDPAVRTADDSGFGAPAGSAAGSALTLEAFGFGPTDTRISPGDVAPAGGTVKPNQPVTAYVGGLRTAVSASASARKPGEFDVTLTVPAGARPGDLITVVVGPRSANRTVFQPAPSAEVQFVPLPEGTPALTNLTDSGVNGNFLMGTAARGSDGCVPAVLIDMAKKSVTRVPDCLTSAAAALAPAVAASDGDTIAALVGPPSGDAANGVSAKVKIFSAGSDPVSAELPSAATILTATATDYAALLPGTPPQVANIDARSGEVRMGGAAGGLQPGGAGGGGGGGGGIGAIGPALNIDGLTHVYSTVAGQALGQGRTAVTIGNDALKPTKAKFAIVNQAGDAVIAKDFPDGWLPLLATPAPARPGAPAVLIGPRELTLLDAPRRVVYALARTADGSKDGLIAFALDTADPKPVPFPAGWFATSCAANVRGFPLDLSLQLALMGSQVAETEFKANCPSTGFIVLDLASRNVAAIPMPVQAQVLSSSANEMNDYVYATGLDTTRTNTSDTIYVLDGVNASVFTLTVPAGVSGFSDNAIRTVPATNSLVAAATRTTPGDQGLVVFNFDQQSAAVLPVPDGFNRVTEFANGACCLSTRKLAARAFRGNGAGIVIYDLVTNEVTLVPFPVGVTSLGPLPAAGAGQGPGGPPGPGFPGIPGVPGIPGGPGGGGVAALAGGALAGANANANTLSAIALNGDKQVGVVVVRVP